MLLKHPINDINQDTFYDILDVFVHWDFRLNEFIQIWLTKRKKNLTFDILDEPLAFKMNK